MTWEAIELEKAIAAFGVFDYATGMAPNVHPDIVWPPSGTDRLRIGIHRGDLHLENLAFDTNRFVEPEADMLIIDGDLTIDGDLGVEQFDVGTPGYLLVKGDLKARNLFLARQFELLVWGDIAVTEVIFGRDRADGSLRCAGEISAPVIVLADYALNAAAANGTVLVQLAAGEDVSGSVRLQSRGGARIRRVEIDEAYDQFWLLDLPEGVSQDDLETPADFAAHAVLTEAALAQYEGAGGALPIERVIGQFGAAAFRRQILTD